MDKFRILAWVDGLGSAVIQIETRLRQGRWWEIATGQPQVRRADGD